MSIRTGIPETAVSLTRTGKATCPAGGRDPLSRLPRLLVLVCTLATVALLQSCKLKVEVPRGGQVVTESKSFSCKPQQTCDIDVVDPFFSETFVATPNPGWAFMRWQNKPRAFCGGRIEPCTLSTAGFDAFPLLVEFLESDEVFYLEPVFEPIPTIEEEDLHAEGSVVETNTGIEVSGALTLTNGQGVDRLFKDANLKIDFNANGEVNDITGTALLPRGITRRREFDADVMAEIGYFTGAQINDNDEIDINLRPERQYMVFYIGGDVSFTDTVSVPGSPDQTVSQKVNTPAAGKIVMILDPNDDMLYRYGETPSVGAYGEAYSDHGLIPFVPYVEGNTDVYRFDGHQYKTISVGVGIKALDIFSLTGEQITYQPSLFDVDLSDPFNSPIAYKAGFNGEARVEVSVLGFSLEDVFNFDLAQSSASFEASKNLQIMTLAANIEPDVTWIPKWIPIVPTTRLAFDLFANGAGAVEFNISGLYQSQLPRADLSGSMRITPQALTLRGVVVDRIELPITLKFENGNTYGTVGITADLSEQINQGVAGGFDRAEDEVAQALADLEQAAADYEFELSLRGLRSTIPPAVDTAIEELNKVPDIVYDAVYKGVKDGIDAKNKCITILGKKTCAISNSTRNSKAASAANTAKSQAAERIKPYKAALAELKRSAQEDDSTDLVSKLEAALRLAYDNRTFKETFTVTVSVDVFGQTVKVTKSYTVNEKVLSDSQAAAVLEAANNVHLIPETSDIVISAREIVDRLPTQAVLDRVRSEVEQGLSQVPSLKGLSYGIIDGKYTAAVLLSDGSRYDVDFNVLDHQAVVEGVADLLVEYAVERF